MTTLVVAEKPSVARDIARVLGARSRGDGFLQGNGYVVTWALGHLVQLAEPDDYGPQWAGRWSSAQLPMVPETWKLKTVKRTAKQFACLRRLLRDPANDRIVCATDAGREGENIFRLIVEHSGCRKPFDRLWISSLTDQAILQGFRELRPGRAFDALGDAARARSLADWLVGMNLTRAYTVHNRVLCTIGRVQTPTLAMIVARDQLIASFEKVYFYELMARLTEGFSAKYSEQGETRIDSKERAQGLHKKLLGHETGTVRKVDSKVRRHRPPPLYDLTSLQRDANRRFGFTAAKVLEQAQALYETHKLISYPRTESHHISEDMVPQLPGILERLQHPQAATALQRLRGGHRLGKAYVDSTKLTDHHAILPTGKAPTAGLPTDLRKVYDLVVARFIQVFLPDQQVRETVVNLDIGGALFIARGAEVLDPGWKLVDPPPPAKGREPPPLPVLSVGQIVHVASLTVEEKETQPPRPYTDATLLSAMKNAGRDIDDDELADAMKGSGLGTPATRAAIIEKLLRTEYVRRERKLLRATEKGTALIGMVAGPLRSPELTAGWEQQLKEIEEGKLDAKEFYRQIVVFVRELLPQVAKGAALSAEQRAGARKGTGKRGRRGNKRGAAARPSPAGLGLCPQCKEGEIVESAKAFGCSRYREGCGFTIWKTVAKLKLSRTQVSQLLKQGHSEWIDGFTSKAGRKFGAGLKLDQDYKVVFDFDPAAIAATDSQAGQAGQASQESPPSKAPKKPAASGKMVTAIPDAAPSVTCPRCGQGRIIEGRRGYGCNRYREGCNFVVWREFGGKRLTTRQILTLIAKGRTGVIRGFIDHHGDKFNARLELDREWQVRFIGDDSSRSQT